MAEQERDYSKGFFDDRLTNRTIRQLSTGRPGTPFTLFAGAGLSADQDVPKWGELVATLLAEQLPAKGQRDSRPVAAQVVKNYFHLPSASIVAESLWRQSGQSHQAYRAELSKRISNILYEKRPPVIAKPSLAAYLLNVAIAAMISKRPVHIVTTNYDDVIERQAREDEDVSEALAKAGITVKPYWDTVPDPTGKSVPEYELPIVHVHGYVPQGARGGNVTFSEGDYSRWEKSLFRDYLAERLSASPFLFVGSTLRDTNSRTLQRWASSQAALDNSGGQPHEALIIQSGTYAAVNGFATRAAQVGTFLKRPGDGLSDGAFESERPQRWTDYLTVPVVLHGASYLELPVGVACLIVRARPAAERNEQGDLWSLLESRDEIKDALLDLGVDLLTPAATSIPGR